MVKNILGITTFGKTAIVVPIHLDKLHLGKVPLVEQHFVENTVGIFAFSKIHFGKTELRIFSFGEAAFDKTTLGEKNGTKDLK